MHDLLNVKKSEPDERVVTREGSDDEAEDG